jgi:hypothetical protein
MIQDSVPIVHCIYFIDLNFACILPEVKKIYLGTMSTVIQIRIGRYRYYTYNYMFPSPNCKLFDRFFGRLATLILLEAGFMSGREFPLC